MTDVEHYAETASAAQNRPYLATVHSRAAAVRKVLGGAHSACSSILEYLALRHGPTPSASALVYGGVVAAGTILYEAWDTTPAHGAPAPGLICERGILRRLTNDLQTKASEEIRLHQDVLGPHFRKRYANGPFQKPFVRFGL